ncbi:hypothetical protein [Methylobacterium iners]|uniref:Uncharacterized protein n=1 Tax=Methylobacterium iners TaxID=418707 RepID=A0ABQ4RV35_9HYPH|nr:hypothetical protein [Methylobacterium iners]GJD93390.1 hypothetical protein OCOJLMKI_0584 [Methylobacterium iners]
MPVEFTCCECGHSVLDATKEEPPLFRLCRFCLLEPGWFRSAFLRAFIDAQHDGLEHGLEQRDAE